MGVAERRQRDREARKQVILEAAADAFGRQGYTDAAMETIAERAHVNIATVYYYYASKEILYLAVLGAAMESALPELERACESGDTAHEKLRGLALAYADFYQRHPDLLLIARYLRPNGRGIDEGARELAEQALMAAHRALDITSDALADGARRGELRRIDARSTAVLLWAGLNGVLQASSFARFEEDTGLVERWLDVTVRGLAAC
jgi:AcrR family transcriptional regulator